MARITNEDCLTKVSNAFELITIASHRAREISTGTSPKIELTHPNEKPAVIALREIACEAVDVLEVREYLIESKRASNTVANILSKKAEEDLAIAQRKEEEAKAKAAAKAHAQAMRTQAMRNQELKINLRSHNDSHQDDSLESSESQPFESQENNAEVKVVNIQPTPPQPSNDS